MDDAQLAWSVQLICPICKSAPEFIIRLPVEYANSNTIRLKHNDRDSHEFFIQPINKKD